MKLSLLAPSQTVESYDFAAFPELRHDVSLNSEALFGPSREHRYFLRRGIGCGGPSLLVTMINPSKAGAIFGDLTVTKLEGFGSRLGAAHVLVVNLYPPIMTDAKRLVVPSDEILALNDAVIRTVVHQAWPVRSVVAWGSHPLATPQRIAAVTALLPKPLWCWGTTRDGQPRHPSRIAYATPLVEWKP